MLGLHLHLRRGGLLLRDSSGLLGLGGGLLGLSLLGLRLCECSTAPSVSSATAVVPSVPSTATVVHAPAANADRCHGPPAPAQHRRTTSLEVGLPVGVLIPVRRALEVAHELALLVRLALVGKPDAVGQLEAVQERLLERVLARRDIVAAPERSDLVLEVRRERLPVGVLVARGGALEVAEHSPVRVRLPPLEGEPLGSQLDAALRRLLDRVLALGDIVPAAKRAVLVRKSLREAHRRPVSDHRGVGRARDKCEVRTSTRASGTRPCFQARGLSVAICRVLEMT